MRVGTLSVVLLVLLAGCGGGGTGTPAGSPTDTPSATPTPTLTPTPTPTPNPAKQNPWRQATVTVGLSFDVAVDNATRHRRFLQEAIAFWNGQTRSYTGQQVRFAYADRASADVVIDVVPTIDECGGETTAGSFGYCTDVYERGEKATGPTDVRVSARFNDTMTRRYYRAVFATMLGIEDAQTVPGVTFVDDPSLRDPWPESNPVVVGIENTANSSRDFTPLVRDAIRYWERGGGARYTNYSVDFELRPNAENPDVVVRFTDQLINCDGVVDSNYVGCSPVYSGENQADETSEIVILGGYTDESTRQTLKHEFGHLHGRLHGQPPRPLMNATFDPVKFAQPDASTLERPWVTSELKVYIDLSNVSSARRSGWRDEISHALTYLSDGGDGVVPDGVRFEFVDNPEEANVVIRGSEALDSDIASDSQLYGDDTDTDRALESYSRMTIQIHTDTPTQDVAYHVAYWLIHTWGDQDEVPDDLDGEDDNREAAP